MNFKTTYLLFGLLAAMLGVLGLVLLWGDKPPGTAEALFPSMKAGSAPLKAADVVKVTVAPTGKDAVAVTLERDGKAWNVTGPRKLPADAMNVNQFVEGVIDAKFDPEKEPTSLAAGGLDKPSRVVTIATADREWTLTVGGVLPGESGVAYVLSSDRPGVPLAVKKRQIEAALEGLAYFRAKDLLGDDGPDLKGVKITDAKKGTVELKKTPSGWRMSTPAFGAVDASALLTAVGSLRVNHRGDADSDFVKDAAEKPADYGLDAASKPLRIDVTRGEGDKETTRSILVGKKEGTKVFATPDVSAAKPDVVRVNAADVEAFTKLLDDPSSVRNKNLVVIDGFKEPDAIDVVNSYGTLEFRKADPAKPWQVKNKSSSFAVDEAEMRKLLDELKKKDVVTTFPDAARRKELGLEAPAVTVSVYADALVKAAEKAKDDKKEKDDKDAKEKPADPAVGTMKKDAKPLAVLKFGNVERDSVAVERVWGDDAAVVMVPMALLDLVRKGPLAYADKTIPPYNPGSAEDNVTKVDIARGGVTTTLTRGEKETSWTIAAPESLKGRKADALTVSDILGRLNRMEARDLYALKGDEKELAQWGLAPPAVKVTVTTTVDKKDTAHEFLFGKADGDKGVFAKVGKADTIYRVPAAVTDLLGREIRDLSVFDFDPSKVETVTLKGYAQAGFGEQTVVFEQKGGTWSSKILGGKIDPGKVTDLVSRLSLLKAERILAPKSALKSDAKKLELVVATADKKTHTLTIGVEDGTGFQATSSTLAGDVFVVGKVPFDAIREAVTYFGAK